MAAGKKDDDATLWLKPATDSVEAIANEGRTFATDVGKIAEQVRDEIIALPECKEQSVKVKLSSFIKEMGDARSCANDVCSHCEKLHLEWFAFMNQLNAESRLEKDVTKEGMEEIIKKLGALLNLCSICDESYQKAREYLTTAISRCSTVVDALAKEHKEVKSAEIRTEAIGYTAAGVTVALGVGAAAATVVTGGFAGVAIAGAMAGTKAAMATGSIAASSLGAGAIGIASTTWIRASRLRELVDKFEKAQSNMNEYLRQINSLIDLIGTMEKQVKSLASNIETGRGMQRRTRDTLAKKDKKLERMMAKLAKMGIEDSDSD